MGFSNGTTYRFTNKAYPSFALNVYGDNAASTGRNVCLYSSNTTDIMQKWVVRTSGNGFRMHSAVNNSYVLDCSDGSLASSYAKNAHLCATSQTSTTDSQVTFQRVTDNVYKIYLPGKKLYLTATNTNRNASNLPASSIKSATALTGGTGGESNVYWASSSSSTKQQWTVSPSVDGGGGGSASEIVVTGMPASSYYTDGKEYFHPDSGMVNGDWNAMNGGEVTLNRIKAFYETVFGVRPAGINNYAYSLFGSKTIMPGSSFHNTYHHGVDLNYYDNAPIRSAHAGTLIEARDNHVSIYDSKRNVTYLYLHMIIDSNIEGQTGINISQGQLLGKQSTQGLGTGAGSHLHFEVKDGNNPIPLMPDNNLNKKLPSISPYRYMYIL